MISAAFIRSLAAIRAMPERQRESSPAGAAEPAVSQPTVHRPCPPARLRAITTGRPPARPHRVVVLGGGFGGLQAALALRRGPVEVTLD